MFEEKRSSERITTDSAIRYQKNGSQDFGNTISRNISKGGISFISHEFLNVSSKVLFKFPNPKDHEIITALGEIIWISIQPHSETYNVGAKFIENLSSIY